MVPLLKFNSEMCKIPANKFEFQVDNFLGIYVSNYGNIFILKEKIII